MVCRHGLGEAERKSEIRSMPRPLSLCLPVGRTPILGCSDVLQALGARLAKKASPWLSCGTPKSPGSEGCMVGERPGDPSNKGEIVHLLIRQGTVVSVRPSANASPAQLH